MMAIIKQAIQTQYIGATDTQGTRIRVECQAATRFVAWDCGLNAKQNHRAAAESLAKSYGWSGRWVMGGSVDGRGYVFVCDCGE